ncbi:chemotaxis protein CheW [Geomonas sp. Red32]|uniref:chemotaxis protein CheW n=1 Tax=Geomonas sp. Red32 TaxID=2912856 RepID=UPI00202D01E4|nr:chemotaxis protein CheW [Geomonas sp. Red32]MCM0083002.1 chemotaxis protein CheW [Geomonas sp. Red32]
MNLAEIRRKAQRAEAEGQTRAAGPAPLAAVPQPQAAAAATPPEPALTFSAAAEAVALQEIVPFAEVSPEPEEFAPFDVAPAAASVAEPQPEYEPDYSSGYEAEYADEPLHEPEPAYRSEPPRAHQPEPAYRPEPAPAPKAVEPQPAVYESAPIYQPPVYQENAPAESFDWQPEALEDLLPSDFSKARRPERFDPASVILKGRETAAEDDDGLMGEEAANATLELLCFRVADEEYAISIMDIKEIIKPREVTEVPRVPAFVRGILSLRGIIIPIFDIRLRLGLPAGVHSERERVIVVSRSEGFCGVLVDEVVQVVRVGEGTIEPPPVVLEGIDREFVQGIGRVGGRMLILLDMAKVLDVSLL